ncbi:MAG: aldo/keto reductase [Candidatus Obscuribacterales bacterium]|nr:aldo/keto reductase [Candidatus Obscuribacterales bacterium]
MSLITYNGYAVPPIMYGTAWKKDKTRKLVELAVNSGFRAIDTANQMIHYNEVGVGEALLDLYKTDIKRSNLFLQTKFTSINGQGNQTPPYDPSADLPTQVRQSITSSLKHLHTDYLDSYVLHGPYSRRGLVMQDWQVWSTMEELFEKQIVRTIGVSNVDAVQLNEFCAGARIKPMFVQNRCYAITRWDKDVRDICNSNKIVYQGFSLLTANPNVMNSQSVHGIAGRLNATPAQVIFRFALDVGMLALTGTTNTNHMKEDLLSPEFKLTAAEIELIENIL